MALSIRIKGHPVHPMLVGFPVTFYVSTLIGDAAYLSTGTLFWYQFAWVTNLLALGFGTLAALAGLAEYFTIPRHSPARGAANSHAILNAAVLVLFFAAYLIRTVDGFGLPETTPPGARVFALTGLSLIGVVGLAVAGWLGWELVYKHRIGVTGAKEIAARVQKGPVFNESDWEKQHGGRDEERPPTNPGDAH